jgi:predicted membrane metal-binding protein
MHFNHTVHSKHASYQIRRLQIQDSHNDMIRKAINHILSHLLPIEVKNPIIITLLLVKLAGITEELLRLVRLGLLHLLGSWWL